ncbi:DnaD domain protein [Lysinibacillus sp. KU-BSD001]|uniref:replication initiation and membrane attachment family protein n=1 Tax=Lysinibacillus sp. KU-BSD001 TaxID=3141328 RepID=UPI0036EABE0C
MYKELLATDHFEITLPQALSTNERQLLTLFYQPLTGPDPISLYLTLWAEGEDHATGTMTHYYLMNVLGMPVRTIFEARIALEAIGLLRTWRKDEQDSRTFIYELVRPLEARDFFADPLLSMFLFSKIGEQAYRKLRNRFCKQVDKRGYSEVTRTFIDVYKPVHTNVPQDILDERDIEQGYPFYYEQFDFALLRAGLSEQLVPSSALTAETCLLIAKLAFLYKLSPLEMQKVVVLALDDTMRLPVERLKKAAADYYKITISKDAPKLAKTFEQQSKASTEVKRSKEQELLHYLENTPPIQVLRDINNGKEPIPASVQLAEDLIMKHNMPIGVVNVLLEYVMLTTDMRLPTKYVEKIADHWIRKNLKTAKEAMDLARQERDKYAKWKAENESKANTPQKQVYKKASGREEKVPDWFYKRDEGPSQAPTTAATVDFEAERQKILQKLGQDGQVN